MTTIPIDCILPNPEQPRREFDPVELESLAESIRQHGLINPISVEQVGEHYILIDGERRTRAAKIAGLHEIEASIRQSGANHERLVLAIVANIQRSNMNPFEQGAAFNRLFDDGNTVADISQMVNLGEGQVRRYMSVIDMQPEIQEFYKTGELSFDTHGVLALQKINDPQQQLKIARIAAKQRMSGQQIARLVKRMNYAQASKPGPKTKPADPSHAERLTASGGHWNMIAQVAKRPAWKALADAAEATCKACQLYDIASKASCRDCPAVDILRRLMEKQP